MDYSRIYSEFIADRKAKPEPKGYTERHHILPRSLGGGDEPENLIRLTAEDHIFAHLLLAKAHGGAMWFALTIMLKPARQLGIANRGKRAIYIAALAKREQSRRQLGKKRPDVSRALAGRPKSEAHRASLSVARSGWRDTPETKAKKSAAMNNPAVQKRIFTVTRAAKISAALRGRERTLEHCAAIARKAKGRYAGTANPRHDRTLRTFIHADGRIEVLTKFEMGQRHGLNRTCLNHVIAGQRRHTKGWSYSGIAEEKADAG